MFCYQCEQTAKGMGCTAVGVCGKDENTALFQDLLVYELKGIAAYAHRARKFGVRDPEIDVFIVEGLFTTVTNVNFDPERLKSLLVRARELKAKIKDLYIKAATKAGEIPEELTGAAVWKPNFEELATEAELISIKERTKKYGEDVTGLQELILYGLKGMAAYVDHAQILGIKDETLYAFFQEALDFLNQDNYTASELLAMALRVGEKNIKAMELLDRANTGTYGHPVPTAVRITPVKGKAILVSGHDLKDLEELLKQTKDQGVNVYTHGEMLPAHGYPLLKKYPQLVGNYGGAWQDQRREFAAFPGAILMTTNCIQKPAPSYNNRIFTSGLVAWPGVKHIADRDFTSVIEAALAEEGFSSDEPEKTIMVGFAHHAVLNVADQVVAAVKEKAIRHFFLIGGCDGSKVGRNYYTELAQALPKDCVILTLACGKYRFNKLDFGEINGLPRLLDVGQCNDAYSAVQIALALAEAFNTEINNLPLSLVLSWYEQKAVAILLSLLHLGIKNIRLGPTLPAFITPEVLMILQEKFNIMLTTTPEEDLKAILG